MIILPGVRAALRPFWALHIVGAASLLPEETYRDYGLPRRLPRGRATRRLVAAAIGAINYGYLLFRPVRQARRRLRQVERSLRTGAA